MDGDKAVGSGGAPGRAVRGEATARHKGMEGRGALEWPAPRMQATGAPRQVRPDATRVCGEPCEGCRRGGAQGVGREALMRAAKGAQGRCR